MAQLHLTSGGVTTATTIARVPLDLVTALPDRGRFDALVVRIGSLPYGASLSAGRNNGDRSWTVTTEELNGLYYRPRRPGFEPHTLICRIIGIIDNEEAVVLDEFDLDITPDGRTPEVPSAETRRRSGMLVNLSRIKAWAEGSRWAAEVTAEREAMRGSVDGPEIEVLQAIFEDRINELAQRLQEAETQIAALKRVAREAHAQLSVVGQATSATGLRHAAPHAAAPAAEERSPDDSAGRPAAPEADRREGKVRTLSRPLVLDNRVSSVA